MATTRRTLLGLLVAAAVTLAAMHALAAGSRPADESALARVVTIAQEDNRAMRHLDHLVNDIGSRPVDSVASLKAYKWARNEFWKFGLDNAHLERCGETKGSFSGTREAEKFRRLHRALFKEKPRGDMVPICNVVADIPGSDLPDEYVIVGAHIDTSPMGPGATDNGAGVAAVMEAARILAEAGVKPRRTIRFILFGGEEVGLVGSRGYLEAHPEITSKISAVYNMDRGANYISGVQATAPMIEDMREAFHAVATLDPRMPFSLEEVEYLPAADPNCCRDMAKKIEGQPGMMRVEVPWSGGGEGSCGARADSPSKSSCCSGASNSSGAGGDPDGGTGLIVKTITGEGDTVVKHVVLPGASCGGEGLNLQDLDLEQLGISVDDLKQSNGEIRKAVALGSSDHAPFLAAGIPAFWWTQEVDEAVPYYAHTREDTYDKVPAPCLEHSASVIALGALGTANLDRLLPRERLAAPAGKTNADAELRKEGGSGSMRADKASGCGSPCDCKGSCSSSCCAKSKESESESIKL